MQIKIQVVIDLSTKLSFYQKNQFIFLFPKQKIIKSWSTHFLKGDAIGHYTDPSSYPFYT